MFEKITTYSTCLLVFQVVPTIYKGVRGRTIDSNQVCFKTILRLTLFSWNFGYHPNMEGHLLCIVLSDRAFQGFRNGPFPINYWGLLLL